MDLEEYRDEVLIAELKRREDLRSQGLCSYCKKPLAASAAPPEAKLCRYHEQYSIILPDNLVRRMD
jgi:hypothetical protein